METSTSSLFYSECLAEAKAAYDARKADHDAKGRHRKVCLARVAIDTAKLKSLQTGCTDKSYGDKIPLRYSIETSNITIAPLFAMVQAPTEAGGSEYWHLIENNDMKQYPGYKDSQREFYCAGYAGTDILYEVMANEVAFYDDNLSQAIASLQILRALIRAGNTEEDLKNNPRISGDMLAQTMINYLFHPENTLQGIAGNHAAILSAKQRAIADLDRIIEGLVVKTNLDKHEDSRASCAPATCTSTRANASSSFFPATPAVGALTDGMALDTLSALQINQVSEMRYDSLPASLKADISIATKRFRSALPNNPITSEYWNSRSREERIQILSGKSIDTNVMPMTSSAMAVTQGPRVAPVVAADSPLNTARNNRYCADFSRPSAMEVMAPPTRMASNMNSSASATTDVQEGACGRWGQDWDVIASWLGDFH